jgi:hypothetical protein
MVPTPDSELKRVLRAGAVRLPRTTAPHFDRIGRVRSTSGTGEILEDLRRGPLHAASSRRPLSER